MAKVSAQVGATPQQTAAWPMYRAMVGIGAICGMVLVGVFLSTAERIRANEQRYLEEAVAEVLRDARGLVAIALVDDGLVTLADGESAGLPAFIGFDVGGNLVGAAISAEGMGYQDTIRVLYAYSFDEHALIGMKVLSSKETPGIGDRIEGDDFQRNFERLDVSLDDRGERLRHPIETVASGTKTSPWQIDGITGATISTKAIGAILDASAARWIPVLERDAAEITAPQPDLPETEVDEP